MKKGLVLLLAILYITLTSGVVVNIHYCMGRIAGVSYGHDADDQCGKCGMEQRNGCCETEHKLVKADNDHIYAKTVTAPSLTQAYIPAIFPELIITFSSSRDQYNSQYHSPPDPRSNNLTEHNSVFRI